MRHDARNAGFPCVAYGRNMVWALPAQKTDDVMPSLKERPFSANAFDALMDREAARFILDPSVFSRLSVPLWMFDIDHSRIVWTNAGSG